VLTSPDAEELRVLALGGSVATPPGGLEAEVVMVRGFEELEGLGEQARGKIVFFNRPMPRILANTFVAYGQAVDQRGHGAVHAARAGGVAALVRSMTTAIDDFPHTGSLQYDAAVPKVPAAAVSTLGAERLAQMLEGKAVRLRLELDCATHPDVLSANVVGEIPGREKPQEIVLVGGHLDAWDVGHGAHDDGCGSVQSIEALRLLRTAGIRPRRTIRAVLFMNEENGLRGAHEYASAHRQEKHFAAIEADRGGFEPRGFSTTLKGPDFVRVQEIVRAMDAWGMGATIPGGGGADIAVLGPMNVPLFGLVTAPHRYFDLHHSERDRIDQVNERELALGAAALAWLAWQLADL
jgi:Zn-dependent M28 family amino/carboxypeptidase